MAVPRALLGAIPFGGCDHGMWCAKALMAPFFLMKISNVLLVQAMLSRCRYVVAGYPLLSLLTLIPLRLLDQLFV